MEHFDLLLKRGFDFMQPDSKGNTVFHLLAAMTIKDKEYDFFKAILEKYEFRLTRNADGKTALNIIRSAGAKASALRGQPNYKKRILEILEEKMKTDPQFMDQESNGHHHELAIRGDAERMKELLDN